MIATASPYLKSLLSSGREVREGTAFPLRQVTDAADFEARFTALFEKPVTNEEPLFRVEENGVILAWLHYTLEEEDGPTPAILFKQVADPSEYIGYNPADLFENQIRQIAEATASSVRSPRNKPGRTKRVVGGYRFTIGQRQRKNRDRAMNLDKHLQGKRAGKRGLASRIRKAKKWHQSFQGRKMHQAQARYQQQTKESVDGLRAFIREHAYRRFHKGIGVVDLEKDFHRIEEQPVRLRAFQSGLDLALGEAHVFAFDKEGTLYTFPAREVVQESLLEAAILYRFPDKETRNRVRSILNELSFKTVELDETGLWLRYGRDDDAGDALRIVRSYGGKEIEQTESLEEKEFFRVSFDPEFIDQPGMHIGRYRRETGKTPWNVKFFFNQKERKQAANAVLQRIVAANQSPSLREQLWKKSWGRGRRQGQRLYKREGFDFEAIIQDVLDGEGPPKSHGDKRHDSQIDIGSTKGFVPVEVKNSHKREFKVTEIEAGRKSAEVSDVFVVRHPSDTDPDRDQIDVYYAVTKSIRVARKERKGQLQPEQRRILTNVTNLKHVGTVTEPLGENVKDVDELALHEILSDLADGFGYDMLDEMPCGMIYVERQSGEFVVSACEHLLTEAQIESISKHFDLPSDWQPSVFEDHYDPKRMLRECVLSVVTEGQDIQQTGPRSWVVDGNRLVLYSPRSRFVRYYPLDRIFKTTQTESGDLTEAILWYIFFDKETREKVLQKLKEMGVKAGRLGKRAVSLTIPSAQARDVILMFSRFGGRRLHPQAVGERLEEVAGSYRIYNDSSGDLYPSLRNLIDKNQGLWKSDKQGKFILDKVRRFGELSPNNWIADLAKKYAPPETKAVIGTEIFITGKGKRRFGKHARRKAIIVFLDSHGIIRAVEPKFGYEEGASWIEKGKEKITFERPPKLAAELVPEGDDPWFEENEEQIAQVISTLKGDRFFGRFVDQLEAGERVPDKMWDRMVGEMEKRTAGYPPFPTEPTKMQIELTVTKAKSVENQYGRHTSWSFVFMGDVKGYAEFGYIKIGESTARKFLFPAIKAVSPTTEKGEPRAYVTDQDVIDFVTGKTFTLQGTFNSNGKMIFGKRVSIKSIEESVVAHVFDSLRETAFMLSVLRNAEANSALSFQTDWDTYTVKTLESGLFEVSKKIGATKVPLGIQSFGEVVAFLSESKQRKALVGRLAHGGQETCG